MIGDRAKVPDELIPLTVQATDQCSALEAKSTVVLDEPVLGSAAADQLALIRYTSQKHPGVPRQNLHQNRMKRYYG